MMNSEDNTLNNTPSGHTQVDTVRNKSKSGLWHSAKWIMRIERDNWELFFDACKEIIEHFNFGPDEPRLTMNLHQSPSSGVLMNLFNRATIEMRLKEGIQMMLMLPKGEKSSLLNGNEIIESFAFSRPANAEGTRVSPATLRAKKDVLLSSVITAAEEIISRSQSSPYRQSHNPDLYRMATDADFRRKALDYLLEDMGDWPGTTSQGAINYWIFKANPKWYDAFSALRDNAVDRWIVAAHEQRIKPGDKAIIWVTGPAAGCYALATITSPITPMANGSPSYAVNGSFNSVSPRVRITIDYNLWNAPIGKDDVMAHMPDLKAGNQGINLSATKDQYEFFLQRAMAYSTTTMHDLNTILYGPPGTGKTFHSVTHAVAIIEQRPIADVKAECEDGMGRKSVRERFERYMANGQVRAVTFHQSFSYEDFVEGIKPDVIGTDDKTQVTYAVKDGVFKQLCAAASSSEKMQRESGHAHPIIANDVLEKAAFWKGSIGYYTDPEDDAIYEYCMANDVFAMGWGEDVDMKDAQSVEDLERKLRENNVSTDGRVLTFLKYLRLQMQDGDVVLVSEGNETIRAIGIVNGPYFMDAAAPIRFKQFRKVEWIYKDISLPVRSVYGNAFTQGTLWQLKPHLMRPHQFKAAHTASASTDQRFVLIIDEINRGNIAGIFGELITLIERDKRAGMEESAKVQLPYSKMVDFSVPANLHIIGTMNTADRSVEALDTALRRRFSFVEMPSCPDLVENAPSLGFSLGELLAALNGRIERLLDKDHHIGHSYFLNIHKAVDPEQELRLVFKNKVLPLLQEYFYADPRKLGAVLGPNWVKKREASTHKLFGKFDLDDAAKDAFNITDPLDATLEDFASIIA